MKKTLLIAMLIASHFACGAETRSLLDGEYRIERVVIDGRVTKPANARLVLSIQGERITGFSGCNRFMGPLRHQAQTIAIGPLAGTRMACLDEARGKLEADVLAALQSVNSFALEAARETVTLRGAQGQLITLARVPGADIAPKM
ncbi:MAG TPA: META domain-containing protein [Chitinolyticbacter sp.]|nr:META domain-containing protein [Chitinolyticbacter sp.]